jgi:hypothetical protein
MHAVWLSASVKYYLGSVRESDVLLLSAVKFYMLFTEKEPFYSWSHNVSFI